MKIVSFLDVCKLLITEEKTQPTRFLSFQILPEAIKMFESSVFDPHCHNNVHGCWFGDGLGEIFHGCSFKMMVPRSWYRDLGTKILVPTSWYQKTESLRGGAFKSLQGGTGGCRPPIRESGGLEAP